MPRCRFGESSTSIFIRLWAYRFAGAMLFCVRRDGQSAVLGVLAVHTYRMTTKLNATRDKERVRVSLQASECSHVLDGMAVAAVFDDAYSTTVLAGWLACASSSPGKGSNVALRRRWRVFYQLNGMTVAVGRLVFFSRILA
jgi:hypothetical protein